MNRFSFLSVVVMSAIFLTGCKDKAATDFITPAKLSEMANAVPNSGPREGNNYKVFFLVLHQNQAPAKGFRVTMAVKGKGQPVTVATNEQGLAQFDNLPFPDVKNPLMASLAYASGKNADPREFTYPYLETDAYRLKDIQYIPNTATPDPLP